MFILFKHGAPNEVCSFGLAIKILVCSGVGSWEYKMVFDGYLIAPSVSPWNIAPGKQAMIGIIEHERSDDIGRDNQQHRMRRR